MKRTADGCCGMTSERELSFALGRLGEFPQSQGRRDALFGGMPDCVADQPLAILAGAGHPAFTNFEGQLGMILGDVAQVVGHAAPDVLFRIIPQRLQNRDHRTRIAEQGRDANRPRESGAGAFAAQSAHVRIRVPCPFQQSGQGSLWPLDEEGAHGELRAEAAGQFILGGHGGLERIAPAVVCRAESIQGDEGHVGQVKEHPQPEPLGAR